MQCAQCGIEMEKGVLKDGIYWERAGSIVATFSGFGAALGNILVHAWKCSQCGKVELAVDVKGT